MLLKKKVMNDVKAGCVDVFDAEEVAVKFISDTIRVDESSNWNCNLHISSRKALFNLKNECYAYTSRYIWGSCDGSWKMVVVWPD